MIFDLLGGLATSFVRHQVSGFNWFQLLPDVAGWQHVVSPDDHHAAWVFPAHCAVVAGILGFAWLARMGLSAAMNRQLPERYIPDTGLSPRNLFEVLVEGVHGIVGGTLKHKDVAIFFPFLGTIFIYILAANLVGFFPGMMPPTENFSTNLAMALTVFLVFMGAGVWRNGWGFFSHLWGPKLPLLMIPINILILVVESFGLLIRPATLTIRLTANIFADHLVAAVIRDLGFALPNFVGVIAAAILPLPFYILGLLVCFLQAFVFTLLSTIYIGLAVAHDDHH